MTLPPHRREPIDSAIPVGSANPTDLLDPVPPVGCEPLELLEPGVDVDQVVTLITAATGADTAAIETLEAVVTGLRRTQAARTLLATQVPTEVLQRALLRQAGASS